MFFSIIVFSPDNNLSVILVDNLFFLRLLRNASFSNRLAGDSFPVWVQYENDEQSLGRLSIVALANSAKSYSMEERDDIYADVGLIDIKCDNLFYFYIIRRL